MSLVGRGTRRSLDAEENTPTACGAGSEGEEQRPDSEDRCGHSCRDFAIALLVPPGQGRAPEARAETPSAWTCLERSTSLLTCPPHPTGSSTCISTPPTHSAFTGSPALIAPRAGAPFRAFDGVLTGTVLHVDPKRVLAQTWRSARWPAGAADSVLVLSFWPEAEGGRIELAHVGVPEEDFAGVSEGWHRYYWAPWRAYLETGRTVPVRV